MSNIAIQLKVLPCDRGRTVEVSLVTGGTGDGVIQLTAAQNGALNGFLALVKSGENTDVLNAVLELESLDGVGAYVDLVDKTGADAYIALDNVDILAVVNAAVGLENMSLAQKAGLLAYIAAIIAEEDTSTVETAITALE